MQTEIRFVWRLSFYPKYQIQYKSLEQVRPFGEIEWHPHGAVASYQGQWRLKNKTIRPGMGVHRFGLEWYEQANQTDGCHKRIPNFAVVRMNLIFVIRWMKNYCLIRQLMASKSVVHLVTNLRPDFVGGFLSLYQTSCKELLLRG